MGELELQMVEAMQQIKSLKHRVTKLEDEKAIMQEMSQSLNVLANEMTHLTKAQESCNKRLEKIEDKPTARMEQIYSAVIIAIVGVVVGYMFGGFGV